MRAMAAGLMELRFHAQLEWCAILWKNGVLNERPRKVEGEMIITREFATASAWTFTIKPIAKMLDRYVTNGDLWIDPFAGMNSPAKYTNDIHPDRKSMYHMDAVDFVDVLPKDVAYQGVLFDPPYSYRQISEHYKEIGRKASQLDTSYNFYTRVMDKIDPLIPSGGLAISFGWNTTGFGIKRGYEKIEILLVAHGAHHNDTLCLVERKK